MRYDLYEINKNHHLYSFESYESMPLLRGSFPMIEEYIEALHKVLSAALSAYGKVFAFRFDLHFPSGAVVHDFDNSVISRFVDSFKAKIRHNREVVKSRGGQTHVTKVRYFWVREVGETGRVHYHFVVLLNGHAFNWLGIYQPSAENMANRIWEAWASALSESHDKARSLVHFPENPRYLIFRDKPESIKLFFQRASYLCKARTKQYGFGHHGYGASRG